MASKASKIGKTVRRRIDPLYNTLVGSIICTIGLTTGKKPSDCRRLFNDLNGNKQALDNFNTIEKIMDYIWTIFGNDDVVYIRGKYILVYDKNNVRTPMVSFTNDEGNIMPIDPKGFTNINILSLAQEGRDWVGYEYLYNEDGTNIGEE